MTRSSPFCSVFPQLLLKKPKPIHAIKAELMLFMLKPHLITLYQESIGLDLASAFAMLSLVIFQIISILTIIITFLHQRQLKA